MRIEVLNRIIIHDAPADLQEWCETNLKINNPDFYKKERMGKWTGGTARTLSLYERVGNDLILPYGCWRELYKMYPDKLAWIGHFAFHEHIPYVSLISLYPYQRKAVEAALKARNGVLVMPCGSGKTQCGLEIVARLRLPALWLTHRQDLLNQSKNRAENVLELPKGALGTITAGKVNIGTHITFATVQTMAKINLDSLRDVFGVVIVDEAQHCAGTPTRVTQFYKVISALATRYKIGLTATPKRADGLQAAMFALLGGKIYEVTREEVAHTTCPVKVSVIPTGYFPSMDMVLAGDGTLNYAKLVDDLTHDYNRMMLVAQTIIDLDGPTIVLGNRVEYLQTLEAQIGGKHTLCLSGMGTSKKAKAERKEALRKLNSGELDVIFATYQLAKEGLDVPNLRYVVFSTPEKDETTVTQAAGRVGRKADGKSYGAVIDFEDDFGMYHGWAKKRKGYYKKLGYEVIR